jgi:Ser/Thr protein kinase RdoA (MazF antagonist)
MVHTMEAGLAAPDWPALCMREIDVLAEHAPILRSPREIVWRSPRPFCAAARIRAGGSEYFVKRHARAVRNAAAVEEEHRFMAHLRAAGFPVPAVHADALGRSAIAVGDWTFEVHGIAQGADLYREVHSWEPVHGEAHARAMGAALAQMHLASRGYVAPARKPRPLMGGFEIVGGQDLASGLARYLQERPAAAGFIAGNGGVQAVLDALRPWHERLRPHLASLEALWVHNDWHASNLFWASVTGEVKVSSVIDFGLSNLGCAISDLATALERNTIAWLESAEFAPSPATRIARSPLAKSLLEGYLAVRTLDPVERAALAAMVPLAHVEYALSEVDYFNGVVHKPHNARLAHPAFLLGHLRWFGSDEGQDYLDSLRSWLAR